MQKNVLITGGAGYVGSVLTRFLLNKGFNVTVLDSLVFGGESILPLLDNPHFRFIRADIRNTQALDIAFKGIDCVVHLAAIVGAPESSRDPQLTEEINYQATQNIVHICKKRGVSRLVFASTCSNYGMSDTSSLADEEAPLNPVSPYAETKIKSEQFITKNKTNSFYPTILRFATVFGLSPRMRFDLLINEFIRDAFIDKKLSIFKPSSWRPFIHVKDACQAIFRVLISSEVLVSGQVYNVGDEKLNIQKGDLASLVKDLMSDLEVVIPQESSDPRDYRVSFKKVRANLDFEAKVSAEEGIREIYEALSDGIFTDTYHKKYKNDGANFNVI